MSFWSNPTPAPGPAFQQAQFQFHPSNIGGVLEAILRDRQQKQAQFSHATQQAIQGLGDYMHKRQSDEIAQSLLDQASYDQGDPLAQQLNESPMHPSDAWAAYQQQLQVRAKLGVENARINEYNAQAERARRPSGSNVNGDSVDKPIVYLPDGTPIQVSPHDAYQHYFGGGTQRTEDPWAKSIPIARGRLDDKGEFTNQYTGAEQGDQIELMTPQGKKMAVPYSAYQSRTSKPQLPTNPSTPSPTPLMPQAPEAPVKTVSKADYDRLPSGTLYIAPDGSTRRKP